jgi:transcriptional regulator with XRE-family HTH domain
MGLRTFAEKIGMFPSNLSDIEHGKKAPPKDFAKLAQIATVLGVSRDSQEWAKLNQLAVADSPERLPADLVSYVKDNEEAMVLLRTTAKLKLTKEELTRLIEDIKKRS